MLRMLKAILAGTVVAAVVGGLYDYSRNGLADFTRGSALEVWFSSTNTQYLMPWLFAIAGLISAFVAALMLRNPAATGAQPAASPAKKPTPQQAKAQAQAGGAADIAGMPSFDFDKAKAQITAPAAPAAATPATAASLSTSAETSSFAESHAVPEPPKEAQP